MLCGGTNRGKKRKSYDRDDFNTMDEDRENLLALDEGDYVCMNGSKLVAARGRKAAKTADCYANKLGARYDEYTVGDQITDNAGITLDDRCATLGEEAQKALKGRGQLHVAIYFNCGLLTVHVIQASQLSRESSDGCCAFVKVSLTPDHNKRTKCRTSIAARSSNPVFDEKFSFELLEEDLKRRILISVWHKGRANEHSECLGCMSFGIQHIFSQRKVVDGWYYLLTEDIGKRKHLQVAARLRFSSPAHAEQHCTASCSPLKLDGPCSPLRLDPRVLSPVRGDSCVPGDPRNTSTPLWDSGVAPYRSHQYPHGTPRRGGVPPPPPPPPPSNEPEYAELTVTPNTTVNQDVIMESQVFVIKRGDGGYGFSVSGSCPVRITRVDSGTPAESVGVQRDDLIVRLNGASMTKCNADNVARIIKASEKKIILEVERPIRALPPGREDTPQFTEDHPIVSTPEYTPLIFKTRPRTTRSPSPQARSPSPRHGRSPERRHHRSRRLTVDTSPQQAPQCLGGRRTKGKSQSSRRRGETHSHRSGSVGMCGVMPVRRVRFYDDDDVV